MNPSTTAITLNMQLPNIATVAWAVQGDQLSRQVIATLVDGATAWVPQQAYLGVIRAHKPDGTVAVYDVDEDGNPAVTWVNNVATLAITQQALTVPGTVLMQLEFYDSQNERITAFGWAMNVQPSAVTDTEFLSSDYYNILSLQIAGVLGATGHAPYIDHDTKNWMLWDDETAQYVDSGYSSEGTPGTPGPAPVVTGTSYRYANNTSGTEVPTSWSSTRPATVPGTWAWTETTITFNDSTTTVMYSVAYQGINGSGAVSMVNNVSPDVNGNVELTPADIGSVSYAEAQTLSTAEKTQAWENLGFNNYDNTASNLSYEVVSNSGTVISGINTLESAGYYGKKLSIMGDSVSTYIGYVPTDPAFPGSARRTVYYTGNNCGVSSVDQTWWMKLINALGMELEVDEAWSGSRVTTTDSEDGIYGAGCGDYRTSDMGNPDVIIIYLGVNDFNNNIGLGTWTGNTAIPTTTTTFREAYAIMMNKLRTNYPLAEIWCCTLPGCERNGPTGAPEINGNGDALNQFNDAIREIANVFGAHILEYGACGINNYNLDVYTGDYVITTKKGLHPNAAGHSLIANQGIRQICPTCGIRYH